MIELFFVFKNLVPAAAYVEMALEFPGVTQIWDCRFENAYILDETGPSGTLQVVKDGINWSVKSSTALDTLQGDHDWTHSYPEFDTIHAYGKLGYGMPEIMPGSITKVDVDAVLARCIRSYGEDEIYINFGGIAQFGPE